MHVYLYVHEQKNFNLTMNFGERQLKFWVHWKEMGYGIGYLYQGHPDHCNNFVSSGIKNFTHTSVTILERKGQKVQAQV